MGARAGSEEAVGWVAGWVAGQVAGRGVALQGVVEGLPVSGSEGIVGRATNPRLCGGFAVVPGAQIKVVSRNGHDLGAMQSRDWHVSADTRVQTRECHVSVDTLVPCVTCEWYASALPACPRPPSPNPNDSHDLQEVLV